MWVGFFCCCFYITHQDAEKSSYKLLTDHGVNTRRFRQLFIPNRETPRKLESSTKHKPWTLAGKTAETHLRLATVWLPPSWPEERSPEPMDSKGTCKWMSDSSSRKPSLPKSPGPVWPWSHTRCSPLRQFHRRSTTIYCRIASKCIASSWGPGQTLSKILLASTANSAKNHCLNNLVNVCFLITVSFLLFWQMSFWR